MGGVGVMHEWVVVGVFFGIAGGCGGALWCGRGNRRLKRVRANAHHVAVLLFCAFLCFFLSDGGGKLEIGKRDTDPDRGERGLDWL
uniref:Transmembrane protein n=1 Tax=Peronospora matthiolae TaxID=2874970 RepID=A0AAV1TCC8_9STRA